MIMTERRIVDDHSGLMPANLITLPHFSVMQNIEFLADPTAGEVRIGSIVPLAASFVSAVIDRLSRRYPRIVFHLVATDADTLHRELSERIDGH